MDLRKAVNSAEDLVLELEAMRDNQETFQMIFSEAETMAHNFYFPVEKSRLRGKKGLKEQTIEEFYHTQVFMPLLNKLIAALNEKFLKHKNVLSAFQYILPERKNSQTSEKDAEHLCSFHSEDINYNSQELRAEIELWHSYISKLNMSTNGYSLPRSFKKLQSPYVPKCI